MSIRSPFFYVGDKYKLIAQLKKHFPLNIHSFVEPFVGGGSGFLNVVADQYIVNDIDTYIIDLHKYISEYSTKEEQLFQQLFRLIDVYDLSCSYNNKMVSDELKKKFKKTYFARHNSQKYKTMKNDFNSNKNRNMLVLYLLLI